MCEPFLAAHLANCRDTSMHAPQSVPAAESVITLCLSPGVHHCLVCASISDLDIVDNFLIFLPFLHISLGLEI